MLGFLCCFGLPRDVVDKMVQELANRVKCKRHKVAFQSSLKLWLVSSQGLLSSCTPACDGKRSYSDGRCSVCLSWTALRRVTSEPAVQDSLEYVETRRGSSTSCLWRLPSTTLCISVLRLSESPSSEGETLCPIVQLSNLVVAQLTHNLIP